MKRLLFTLFGVALSVCAVAQRHVSQERMAEVYDEARTPYKYGMVIAPEDNHHKIDCPTVFRENDRWYMTYVVYDGKGAKGQEYYGISDKMSFAVDYAGKGILTGHGRCSTQEGYGIWTDSNGTPNNPEDVTVVNNLADETGQEGAQYCYCQVDGFTPTGGDKVIVTSAPWVFRNGDISADSCASSCASNCVNILQNVTPYALAIRASVMNNLPTMPATCAANTINIDWNPDNNGAHIKNMCTYDGSITVPSDPVKPGYTFAGWKLLEENK